jgi:hypothetical protein
MFIKLSFICVFLSVCFYDGGRAAAVVINNNEPNYIYE